VTFVPDRFLEKNANFSLGLLLAIVEVQRPILLQVVPNPSSLFSASVCFLLPRPAGLALPLLRLSSILAPLVLFVFAGVLVAARASLSPCAVCVVLLFQDVDGLPYHFLRVSELFGGS